MDDFIQILKNNNIIEKYNLHDYGFTDDYVLSQIKKIYQCIIEDKYIYNIKDKLENEEEMIETLANEFKYSFINITIKCTEVPTLTRNILLPVRANMLYCAAAIMSSVRAEGTHLFTFISDEVDVKSNVSKLGSFRKDEILAQEANIIILHNHQFKFHYDYNDDWTFDIEVNKPKYIKTKLHKEIFIITEAQSYGIWDDNKWLLIEYIQNPNAYAFDIEDEEDEDYLGKINEIIPFKYEECNLLKLKREIKNTFVVIYNSFIREKR